MACEATLCKTKWQTNSSYNAKDISTGSRLLQQNCVNVSEEHHMNTTQHYADFSSDTLCSSSTLSSCLVK